VRAVWRPLKIVALALTLFASACAVAPPIPSTIETKPPTDFPASHYLDAAKRGEAVYRIDPADSLATIYSYRTRLGHNHVVASRDVNGFVRLTRVGAQEGEADLYVALDALTVDEAALRAEAGFDTQPSESDIAGTRNNLLTKVLETEKFPHVQIRIERLEREAANAVLVGTLRLHGVTQPLRIPAELEINDNGLRVAGKFSLRQTDFGITPFSVLGGLFQVKDEIDLRFALRARRLQ
jgi:polyisoprenoid-binding protein YceI